MPSNLRVRGVVERESSVIIVLFAFMYGTAVLYVAEGPKYIQREDFMWITPYYRYS